MKIKYVKVQATNEDGHMFVPIRGNTVVVNKSGFVPVKGAWLDEMNPARVKAWYNLPKGVTI